jgi:hypothetical protein
MTTVTFDTLEAVAKLKAVGVSQEHADAFIRAIADAQSELATKRDLKEALDNLETRLLFKLPAIIAALLALFAALQKAFFN